MSLLYKPKEEQTTTCEKKQLKWPTCECGNKCLKCRANPFKKKQPELIRVYQYQAQQVRENQLTDPMTNHLFSHFGFDEYSRNH